MKVICTDGTTLTCESFEAIDSGVLLYDESRGSREEEDEREPEATGFVPLQELKYVLPEEPGGPGGIGQQVPQREPGPGGISSGLAPQGQPPTQPQGMPPQGPQGQSRMGPSPFDQGPGRQR
ncbi:hypothetical protein VB773_22475 [Haloarculaceae archaeon H-GB2-1]|nr:hypothetical protein [Haloarculaceae archaeon H-GB1-1]MEA5389481.1 hypothetical protein [Haloarculaceae archaeon H-GB11]MEA5410066.1 hypothetical protein [Haloarculaceae archaeon H-GB2-1]